MTDMKWDRRSFLWLSGVTAVDGLGLRHLLGDIGRGGAGARMAQAAGPGVGRPKLLGIMVDAARLPATPRYYQRVIEFCGEWGLNALHFRLTDDQGSALRFTSVPGLITHPNALTVEQMRSLVDHGRQHGVELIPEVESFGHTGYITRSARYAHLLDNGPSRRQGFSGVIPVDPETLQLFGAIYREVAAIFPSIYFHGGCDEVNWGGSALSRTALRTRTRAQIWAAYLNALNGICEGLGKQFIVWGDYVLHKEPEILGLLQKNIIVMDWQYQNTDPISLNASRLKLRANGSRAIGAPALLSSNLGPRPGTQQLANIDAFAEAYLKTNDPAAVGVILTNWVPTRFLQDSIWDGFAYAAVAFTKGSNTARSSSFQRFVEQHYAADWNETWSDIFHAIYSDAPSRAAGRLPLLVPWSTDEELTTAVRQAVPASNPFTRLRSRLVLVEPSVRQHLSDFQGFCLSVEYLERMYWRQIVVRLEAAKHPLDQAATTRLITSIAARDRALAAALSQDWDKGRPADSPQKTGPIVNFDPRYQLVFQWQKAADYSASLAADPGRFFELLKTTRTD